jgi:starch synthase
MYAQRYGTVPVVHATGGLKDSVDQYVVTDQGAQGTGWKFSNCDANGLKWGLWEAMRIYKKEPEEWAALRTRCMHKDFSWSGSADKYLQIFRWALMDPPLHQPWPF